HNIDRALTAWLALTRVAKSDAQQPLLERLGALSLPSLSSTQKLEALRVYELAFSRLGQAPNALLPRTRERLDSIYPTHDWHLDHHLCALLVYLNSPSTIPKTLDLLAGAERSEDFMQYLFTLRYVREGWTESQREAWFRAMSRAEQKQGARDYYA